MNLEVYNHLQKENLEELNVKLIAYAYARLRHLNWGHQHEGTIKGKEANDYVQEAISLALTGERKWNKSKYPEFLNFLKGITSSLISNDIKSPENKTSSSTPLQKLEELNSTAIILNLPSTDLILIANEMKVSIKAAVEKLDNDPKVPLVLIFDAQVAGMRPREIMNILELEPTIVRNAMKRIRRVTHKTLKMDKKSKPRINNGKKSKKRKVRKSI